MQKLLRLCFAIILAKLIARLCRALGRAGSTLPGRVALRIAPGLIETLAQQARRGTVVVTGTNGKTTTATMLATILRSAGYRVVHNREGANLLRGLASTLCRAAGVNGRLHADVVVMEVDEATVPQAIVRLRPMAVVVTNFFRDQLDRYGELERTVGLVAEGIARLNARSCAVLCADDPLVAELSRWVPCRLIFFGVETRPWVPREMPHAADAKYCRQCDAPYRYEFLVYGHLGSYLCPRCGHRRPRPDVRLARFEPVGASGCHLEMRANGRSVAVRLKVPGAYNAYNALAACAAALSMGIHEEHIIRGLESFRGAFGRMEAVRVGGRRVLLALVKNPAGFNEVISALVRGADSGTIGLVVAINDRQADGTDVSWLWDVDFERLTQVAHRIQLLVTSGTRAHDMAVRLKYAGMDPARIQPIPGLGQAIRAALDAVEPDSLLYLLCSYTAMLQARRALERMKAVGRIWEDQ